MIVDLVEWHIRLNQLFITPLDTLIFSGRFARSDTGKTTLSSAVVI